MRTRIVGERKGFEPFTLELTFESEDEVREMWHRMNPHYDNIKKIEMGARYPVNHTGMSEDIWEIINAWLNEHVTKD